MALHFRLRVNLLCLCFLLAQSCTKVQGEADYPKPDVSKKGETVVQIGPVSLTTDELENRINRQSPFMRERLSDEVKRVAYINNEARFELLAQEAWRRGFSKTPQIIAELKRAMVQKLVRDENQRLSKEIKLSEAELRAGFAKRKHEYNKPANVRFSQLVRYAKRPQEQKQARSFLTKLQEDILADEKKGQAHAFARRVKQHSSDLQTKSNGGDLGFMTREAVQALYGAEVTETVFDQLKVGDTVIANAQDAVVLFKKTGRRKEIIRSLEMVKPQLRAKLIQAKRSAAFEKLVKRLAEQAGMSIDKTVAAKIKIDLSKPIGAP
jgi:hypothetical protein